MAASKLGTLIAGALGSLVFVFLLTALSNFQMSSIGEQVKAGLTEVFLCLIVAVIASATIHRVAITVRVINKSFFSSSYDLA